MVGDGCFVGGGLAGFVIVGWVVDGCGKCGLDFGFSRLLMMVLMFLLFGFLSWYGGLGGGSGWSPIILPRLVGWFGW